MDGCRVSQTFTFVKGDLPFGWGSALYKTKQAVTFQIMNEKKPVSNGEVCRDLPSPYIPHRATGLLHLPRFIAKIRKHLKGELPASYQRNFCRGFDRFLCLHLGVDPGQVVEAVRTCGDDDVKLDAMLLEMFPGDCRVAKWNRELVQKGMSKMGQEALLQAKASLQAEGRDDILSFADILDLDEGRIL